MGLFRKVVTDASVSMPTEYEPHDDRLDKLIQQRQQEAEDLLMRVSELRRDVPLMLSKLAADAEMRKTWGEAAGIVFKEEEVEVAGEEAVDVEEMVNELKETGEAVKEMAVVGFPRRAERIWTNLGLIFLYSSLFFFRQRLFLKISTTISLDSLGNRPSQPSNPNSPTPTLSWPTSASSPTPESPSEAWSAPTTTSRRRHGGRFRLWSRNSEGAWLEFRRWRWTGLRISKRTIRVGSCWSSTP